LLDFYNYLHHFVDEENISYAIKVSYFKNLIDLLPTPPTLSNANLLSSLSLSDQVKILNKFVYNIHFPFLSGCIDISYQFMFCIT
jgi:hypothetical protein